MAPSSRSLLTAWRKLVSTPDPVAPLHKLCEFVLPASDLTPIYTAVLNAGGAQGNTTDGLSGNLPARPLRTASTESREDCIAQPVPQHLTNPSASCSAEQGSLDKPNCTQCPNPLVWTDGGEFCDDDRICYDCGVRCSRNEHWWFCQHCSIDLCATCAGEQNDPVSLSIAGADGIPPFPLASYSLPSYKCNHSFEESFSHASQTIVIFDWDDTLLATHALVAQHGLTLNGPSPDGSLAQQLEAVAQEIESLLEHARSLATGLMIVTNAQDGWVETSCKAWMPQLWRVLESIPTYSARTTWEPLGFNSPTCWKAREFESRITGFYSRYPNESWKNLVAIGDAQYEHEALRRVVQESAWKSPETCRAKSVRFNTKPSIDELRFELQSLRQKLGSIISHDGNLDIQIARNSLETSTE